MKSVHVVGAGLAGLSAAVALTEAGAHVTLHDSNPAAGGRCRSYYDKELGCRLDNGNHLVLSGNRDTFAYLATIGATDTMIGPDEPEFPFMDLATGERWTVRPNRGRIPWWVLAPSRAVPGARLRDFVAAALLSRAGPDTTVQQALPAGELYRRLLEPLAIAALNTPPATASARLMGAVMDESLSRGGAACRPMVPRDGLSESFVDPALAYLTARGATIRLGHRVGSVTVAEDRVVALDGEPVDSVVIATPAPVSSALLPGLIVPDAFESILNVHFRIDIPDAPVSFIGLLGGVAEWIFVKPGVVSITVSAGNDRAGLTSDALAQQVWSDVHTALAGSLDGAGPIPPYRVVREKRATFAATPAQDRRRPAARTAYHNLVLAGDWTATGLPATIEGAIRSGRTAASALCHPS